MVQAMAVAPSTMARSPASVIVCAVNSGWWFTAGSESIPMAGWIDGIASDTLPMSVEPDARGSNGLKVRPSASALRR